MQPHYTQSRHTQALPVLLRVVQPRVERLVQRPHLPALHDLQHERAQLRPRARGVQDDLGCLPLVLQVLGHFTAGTRCVAEGEGTRCVAEGEGTRCVAEGEGAWQGEVRGRG